MNLAGHRDRRISENYFEPCTGQPRCQSCSSKGTSICLAASSLSLSSLNVPGCLLLSCSFSRLKILSCLKMSPSRSATDSSCLMWIEAYKSCWYIQYALFLIATRKWLLSELTRQALLGMIISNGTVYGPETTDRKTSTPLYVCRI